MPVEIPWNNAVDIEVCIKDLVAAFPVPAASLNPPAFPIRVVPPTPVVLPVRPALLASTTRSVPATPLVLRTLLIAPTPPVPPTPPPGRLGIIASQQKMPSIQATQASIMATTRTHRASIISPQRLTSLEVDLQGGAVQGVRTTSLSHISACNPLVRRVSGFCSLEHTAPVLTQQNSDAGSSSKMRTPEALPHLPPSRNSTLTVKCSEGSTRAPDSPFLTLSYRQEPSQSSSVSGFESREALPSPMSEYNFSNSSMRVTASP